MINTNKSYYILSLAVAIGLIFHGTSFLSTLEDTYDLYVHVFFADHYSKSWFDPWETRWYTGFSLISYPPLVHQLIALLSFIGGIKFATYLLCFAIVVLYVTGAFRFAKLVTANEESAGYAALIAVFLPSVIEAFHVFGQIPMMMGISWLLHALPEIYKYIRSGKLRYFISGLSLIAVAVCSHHVTPIFGMVFFVVPLMGTAIMDGARSEVSNYREVTLKLFIKYLRAYIKRILAFGFSTIFVTIFVILPYWLWSKSDPISQVPIPHGSRDNFIEVFSSGLIFFIIPWGFLLLMLPFYFYRYFSKRNLFFGFSFTMLFILGTGGTTPIPKMLLGDNAFNILTLERFTFWATIYVMPMAGEFIWRFIHGDINKMILLRRSKKVHSLYVVVLIVCMFFSAGFTTNLSFFRPLQPKSIDLLPLKNFLQTDQHYKWRYLTLGFGDQMAWLSANTNALTIDGNYHSARRVPELTTRAVERLENTKYRGVEGMATLQQFLSNPEQFHLKYIFSNDKFYDPILYFNGWHRVKHLDNNIIVWERSDVSALPAILPKKDIPMYQKVMWGTIPLLTLLIAFVSNVQMQWVRHLLNHKNTITQSNPEKLREVIEPVFYQVIKYWIVLVLGLTLVLIGNIYWLNIKQGTHERVLTSYYNALDFKNFNEAFEMLDSDSELTLDYFLLEISVTNGLMDSYGKINRIEHRTLEKTVNYAKVESTVEWVTPLKSIVKTETHEVIKKGWKWYMKPLDSKNYIPSDQFSTVSSNNFINQGRRKITTKETFHEDVLDRPVTMVHQASLIQSPTGYHVVGLIQNVDSYPVDLTIKASLLDSSSNVITSYYDQHHLIHKLLPKGMSGFRIDFEDVHWRQTPDSLKQRPASFQIEVLGTVITQDLNQSVILTNASIQNNQLDAQLYNQGNATSTITQLIGTYFNENKEIIWVESSLTNKSIFPKKSTPFNVMLKETDELIKLDVTFPIIKINGLNNDDIASKYRGIASTEVNGLLRTDTYRLLIHLNNFVSNPGQF